MKNQQEELHLLFAELQLYSLFEEEFLFAMEEIHKRLREIIIELNKASATTTLAELEVTKTSVKEAELPNKKQVAFITYAAQLDKAIVQTLQTVTSLEVQMN
jgi:hypothetical protein